MFVAALKHMMQTLPCHEEGCDALIERIQQEDPVCNPATDFFVRVTNYALNKFPPPSSADTSPVQYDPRLFLTALVISRFPIEILGEPEEPLRFTLLNKAIGFLEVVDGVLFACAEDDAADDFLDDWTCLDFLRALNEFHCALNVLSSEGNMNVCI
jgi:hypothetical protein